MTSTDVLPADRKLAAYLEASGATRAEIATAVGVTPKTISEWRQEAAYQQELTRWTDSTVERVDRMLTRIRLELMEASLIGIRKLIALTEAVDPDGRPMPSVQARAAEMLAQKVPIELAVSNDNGNKGGAAAAAVIIVQRGDKVETTHEEILGEVTKVEG